MAQTRKPLSSLELIACKIHGQNFIYVVDNQINRKNEDVQLLCIKCIKNLQSDIKYYTISDAIDGINTFIAEYDKGKENIFKQLTRLEKSFDEMLRKFKSFMTERIGTIKKQFDNIDVKELKQLQTQQNFTFDELNKFVRIQRKFIFVNTNIKEQAQISEEYLRKDAERDMQLEEILKWFTELNNKCEEMQNNKLDINIYLSKRLSVTKMPNAIIQQQIEPLKDESIIIRGFRKSDKKVERFLDKWNQIVINQQRIFYVQIKKKLNLKGIYISSDIDFKNQDNVELELTIYNDDKQDQQFYQNTFKISPPIDQSKEDNYLIFPNFCTLEADKYYTFSLINKSKPIKCRLYEKLNNNEEINCIKNPKLSEWKNSFYETEYGLIKAFQFES